MDRITGGLHMPSAVNRGCKASTKTNKSDQIRKTKQTIEKHWVSLNVIDSSAKTIGAS